MGSQMGPRLPKVIFWSHFWLLLGAFGEHFWGHFSSEIRNGRAYVDFLVPFFRSRKKERTRGCPGGGHAIHPRQRIFREGRPSSLRLHFGLHFGVILGAKFATILFFGRPGGQNRLTKVRLNKNIQTGEKETPQGTRRGPPPPPTPAEPPRRTP